MTTPSSSLGGAVDAIREGVREVTQRLSAVAIALAGMRRDDAGLARGIARLAARAGRRFERVERRLDLGRVGQGGAAGAAPSRPTAAP